VWQLITAGAALCVSVTVINRYVGTNYFADYLLEEITICPLGANEDAVIDTVVEEYRSKTVRLEFDAAHPRRTTTVYVEHGRILEQPRHIVYT